MVYQQCAGRYEVVDDVANDPTNYMVNGSESIGQQGASTRKGS